MIGPDLKYHLIPPDQFARASRPWAVAEGPADPEDGQELIVAEFEPEADAVKFAAVDDLIAALGEARKILWSRLHGHGPARKVVREIDAALASAKGGGQ